MKAPGKTRPKPMFRKPIKARRFKTRYAAMIGQPADAEFFRSCFEERDSFFVLKENLDDASVKRLNKLAKVITSNRGHVKGKPLALALAVLAAVTVFGLLFMNPLLERLLESGLESAFGAKSEVNALRFLPLELRFYIGSVAVADREAPMTNLFETGKLSFDINFAAALRGKIYIEEMAADSIRVGTPRSVSGALAPVPKKPKKDEAPLVDFAKFDAMALLEREKNKLASVAAYNEAAAAYEESSARWQSRVDSSTKAVTALQTSTQSLLATDVGKLGNPQELAKAITEAKTAIDSVKGIVAETQAIGDGLKKDAATIGSLEKKARAAVDKDIAYLRSLVDLPSGTALRALEPSIRAMLSDKLERYLYYAERGWGFLREFRARAPKKQAPPPSPRGRTLYFPSVEYPAFRLGLLTTDFPTGDMRWKVELREISSDPVLVRDPTRAFLGMSLGSMSASADVTVDLRKATAAYDVLIKASGIDLELDDYLSALGLSNTSAVLAAQARAAGSESGNFTLSADCSLARMRSAQVSGVIGKALVSGIEKVGTVKIGIETAKAQADAQPTFVVRSNLDELLKKALTDMAKEYAKQAQLAIEKALRDYIETELQGKLGSKADFESLLALAKDNSTQSQTISAKLKQKLKELEEKAKSMGGGILPGGIPSLPGGLPGLPALPKP